MMKVLLMTTSLGKIFIVSTRCYPGWTRTASRNIGKIESFSPSDLVEEENLLHFMHQTLHDVYRVCSLSILHDYKKTSDVRKVLGYNVL